MKTVIKGLGLANPPLRMTQEEVYRNALENFKLSPKEADLYKRLLLDGRIRKRHFGMKSPSDMSDAAPSRLLSRFLDYGLPCAAEAARKAMEEARTSPDQIEGIVVNTCTGYLCPGLSSYLAGELELRKSIGVLDLMGMGCGAALPNLDSAAGMLSRRGKGPILSVAVEMCSSTIFPSHEPELIVSNCIFGDGAAAAVLDLSGDGESTGLARLVDFESGLFPEHREELRYRSEGGLLRNSLSKRVPVIGAKAVVEVCGKLLARNGLAMKDIDFWGIHPGGTLILSQVAKKMGLDEKAMSFSYGVFEDYGNMSSPSILFVLKRILERGVPKPGQRGVLLSFGAGFSAFASLIEF